MEEEEVATLMGRTALMVDPVVLVPDVLVSPISKRTQLMFWETFHSCCVRFQMQQ